ncbi:DUF932 domain-containing protein [Paenibacillus anaericanus]|uniref:DUF932 domain-containing protein n=1 Tax=Paenibacillus anaericanus TaxID=170367 RepID=UPI003520ED8D
MLGVVTDRYRIVPNHEAFAFTDELLGEGIRFETAKSKRHYSTPKFIWTAWSREAEKLHKIKTPDHKVH